MQITSTTLNIPPYISTSWEQIAYLKTVGDTLIITLKNEEQVSIPNLAEEYLQQIFDAHALFLEKKGCSFTNLNGFTNLTTLHHNPEDSQLPDLPPDILEKIVLFTKALDNPDTSQLIPADSTCNCTFCQIARAMNCSTLCEEERIDDAELAFRDWQIDQIDTKLYLVTSPLDATEQYKVFLGEPIGCNCGENHCEHIKAVLES